MILIVVPTFFLFLYGYALNFDIRHVSMAVEDRDDSSASRGLVAAFQRSTYFDLVGATVSDREAAGLVDRGLARIVLVIPAGFSDDLDRGDTAEVQVIIDGDNANTATTVLGYVVRRAARRGRRARDAPAWRWSPWSRVSGTTRSCAAPCSSCPVSSRSFR